MKKKIIGLLIKGRTILIGYSRKIITWYLFPWMLALLIILPIVYFLSNSLYSDTDTWKGILIEAHGMILDIIVIGILVSIISKQREKNLETKRYIEEIDDYRGLKSKESIRRVSGLIKRLSNNYSFTKINLENCVLKKTNLEEVNLKGAYLVRTNLEGAILESSNFRDANFIETNMKKTQMMYSNFEDAYVNEVNFQNSNLVCANFKNALISGSDFLDADLRGANFEGVRSLYVNFSNSNLTGSKFENALLMDVDLRNANLTDASVELFQLQYAKELEGLIMPDGSLYDGEWKKRIESAVTPESYREKWHKSS